MVFLRTTSQLDFCGRRMIGSNSIILLINAVITVQIIVVILFRNIFQSTSLFIPENLDETQTWCPHHCLSRAKFSKMIRRKKYHEYFPRRETIEQTQTQEHLHTSVPSQTTWITSITGCHFLFVITRIVFIHINCMWKVITVNTFTLT